MTTDEEGGDSVDQILVQRARGSAILAERLRESRVERDAAESREIQAIYDALRKCVEAFGHRQPIKIARLEGRAGWRLQIGTATVFERPMWDFDVTPWGGSVRFKNHEVPFCFRADTVPNQRTTEDGEMKFWNDSSGYVAEAVVLHEDEVPDYVAERVADAVSIKAREVAYWLEGPARFVAAAGGYLLTLLLLSLWLGWIGFFAGLFVGYYVGLVTGHLWKLVWGAAVVGALLYFGRN